MKEQIKKVIEWHEKFQVPYKKIFDYEPLDNYKLRARIMIEEVKEWESAAENESLVDNRAKELADILYTVLGTIITEGLQDVIEEVFDEVHHSNMSKLDDNGNPVKRHDGKVLKGANYKEPDLFFLRGVVFPHDNGTALKY